MALVAEVSRYIIRNCQVDNLKLQKLLYYSQGIYMVLNDGKLLFDEAIEAWDYGPVVSSVYHTYKKFGLDCIVLDDDIPANLTAEEIESIDMVLGYYGDMTGASLIGRTHSEDPWKNNYKANKPHVVIPTEDIYDYFKSTIKFSN